MLYHINNVNILKNSCNLWNSTLVVVEDQLSSTTVDFIRSHWKLKTKPSIPSSCSYNWCRFLILLVES